jgi:hypothetical protein
LGYYLKLFVAQIDGKLLVHGNEAAGSIVNFLHEARRVLIGVNFFDVTGASACMACKLANVSSPTIRQLFPMSEFAFVFGTAMPLREQAITELRLTQPPLQH